MLHPEGKIRFVNDAIGYGVFTDTLIPAGTIVFARDPLDIGIPDGHPLLTNPDYAGVIQKYSYIEPDGSRVISWDLAKYVNHSCDSNTLSTGYGFEIALRDILPGEEITDDYGPLNVIETMCCSCGSNGCRSVVDYDDFERLTAQWDQKVRHALSFFDSVPQPLLGCLTVDVLDDLRRYLETGHGYRSVAELKFLSPSLTAFHPEIMEPAV